MYKKWTNEEVEFLKENYEKGLRYCVNEIGRSEEGVRLKCRKLELKIIKKRKIKNKYEKEHLCKIVAESRNYTECMINLNMSKTNGSSKTIKKINKTSNLKVIGIKRL